MTSRNYSATAVSTTLAAGITATATSVQVAATTGFPAAPYLLALDYGTASQELVLVTAVAGTTLTVTRAYDSTTGVTHSLGAAVKHVHSAIDFRDSRTHENASSGVHGLTGSVVGTTDTQALSNKDLTAGTNSFPTSLLTTTTGVQVSDPTSAIRVKCATTTNITLSGTQTIDTIAAGVGDLVLVKNQSTASQNGVYAVAAGAWSRATGFNSSTKIAGAIVSVLSGSQGGTDWNTSFKSTDTLDTTSMTWAQLADTSSVQTLTNKTLDSPTFTNVGEKRYVEKASDQGPLASTTTFTDDTALQFSVVANATYEVTWTHLFTGVANTGGLKWQVTGPAGATGDLGTVSAQTGPVYSVVNSSLPLGSFFLPSVGDGFNTGPVALFSTLRIKTSGTAGTVKVQFAQQTSNVTGVTSKAGSNLTIIRVV